MGGGGGSTPGVSPPSQSTSFKPWKAQVPYVKDIYSQAQAQSQNPLQYYPGSTVAPQDEATIAAQNMTEGIARRGNPLVGQAQGLLGDTLGGKFLNSNPYIDATYNQAARGVTENFNNTILPGLESRFAAAGRIGSGAYGAGLQTATNSLGRSLGDLATNIYGTNYANERSNQNNAIGQAGQTADLSYQDVNHLADVGAARTQNAQSLLDDLVQRFNFNQQEPANRLARYASTIGAPIGGQATSYGNTARGGNWLGFFGV